MKRLALVALFVMGFAATADAQCFGGSCGIRVRVPTFADVKVASAVDRSMYVRATLVEQSVLVRRHLFGGVTTLHKSYVGPRWGWRVRSLRRW